jgi:hypothetical protein
MDPFVRGGKRSMQNRNNPHNLTQKQLDELELTKKQVAKHLETIDFDKHDQVASDTDLERAAFRVLQFTNLMSDRLKKGGKIR